MRYILSVFFILIGFGLAAQDPQFSQFAASPLYLNPGYAGTTEQYRVGIAHRIQWPSLPKAFNTTILTADYNMSKINSGLGIMFYNDKVGTAGLSTTNASVFYSYKIRLQNNWIVSPGIQFGATFRDLDVNKLLFGDQINVDFDDGVTPISLDPAIAGIGGTSYVDIGTGIVIYNETIWLGVSAHHLNQPDQSLIGQDSQLPVRASIHGGVRIPLYRGPRQLDRISSLAPSFIYRKQAQFDQLDLGFQFIYNPVIIGLWYRGIPIQQNAGDNISQDAIAFMFGLRFDQFDLGYSYDITISELGPSAGGAHEFSLTYHFNVQQSHRVRRKEKFIPCPTF